LSAVITGGASGIGAATGVELGRLGADVLLADLPGADATETMARIRDAGGQAHFYPVDVRDYEAVAAMAVEARSRLGPVDVLFANAGIHEASSLLSGDPKVWRNVVETNLLGVAYCVRAFAPAMATQERGDIVINASDSGREIVAGSPLYTASKWGVVAIAHVLRCDLASSGSSVRVTVLEPGMVDTPLLRAIPGAARSRAADRALQPADVARLVAFVVTQPSNVLIHEIRIDPIYPPLKPSLARRVARRAKRALT
jgi:NADP-dependent 3-hydroxy acid dehydrogenase YdfG